jgi:metal-responsive CopG/Arc/MetJ family transcriptional regulator
MKTVQMTLDDELVSKVDKVVTLLHTSRSAFARDALKNAVEQYYVMKMEEKQKKGYKKKPVSKDEFADWENEQVWGDE